MPVPNQHTPIPHRGLVQRILWLVLVLGVAATGCAASEASPSDVAGAVEVAAPATVSPVIATRTPSAEPTSLPPTPVPLSEAPGEEPSEDPAPSPTASEEPEPVAPAEPALDFSGTALPPAPIGFEAVAGVEQSGPQPVSLTIGGIDVVDADILPVGVNPDQTFEVPPADQVGWYRFGPTPGDEGSAVLAAHIAFNGVDGVFRRLADVEVGAIVTVAFDDGSTRSYRVESLDEYLKDQLPEELFARTGDPQIALITCGGDFNRQLSSYESNTVAVAVPL